jgi:hypothetical protein
MTASRLFIFLSGMVLLTTGVAKLASAVGSAPILYSVSPIIPLSFRHLMVTVGMLEVMIGLYCTVCSSRPASVFMIAWISSAFLAYRISLWAINWKVPCPCMGSLTSALHLTPKTADRIMKIILTCLLVGSYSIIACGLFRRSVRIGD